MRLGETLEEDDSVQDLRVTNDAVEEFLGRFLRKGSDVYGVEDDDGVGVVLDDGFADLSQLLAVHLCSGGIAHWGDVPGLAVDRAVLGVELINVLYREMELVDRFGLDGVDLSSEGVPLLRSFNDVPPGAEAVVGLDEAMCTLSTVLSIQDASISDILQASHSTGSHA